MDHKFNPSYRESCRAAVAQILASHGLLNSLDVFDQGWGVVITIRDWDGRNHAVFEEALACGKKLGFRVQAAGPND
jgi:hypothetical protein